MTLEQVLLLGGFVAAVIGGLIGVRRGDALKLDQAKTASPFALVGPTLADSMAMQQWTDAIVRLAATIEKQTEALNRFTDHKKETQNTRIEELLQKLIDQDQERDRRSPRR